jgi:Family of unknown function (DUF6090)
MINFFRKIRYDLIGKNKTGKYLKYALGEIVLVVIGILIALSINNWNEDRKSRIFERETLKNLKVGMELDLLDIEGNIKGHRRGLESQNIVINWFESDLPYTDSLCHHFASGNWFTVFVSDKSSFETLKTIGVNLISSDSLRDKILYLYESRYEIYNKRELVFNKLIEKMIYDVNSKYFSESFLNLKKSNLIGCMHPNNPHEIKRSTEYIYYLKTIREFNLLLINTMDATRVNLNDLIEMIDHELEIN